MSSKDRRPDELGKAVERRRERRRAWAELGERPLGELLGLIGSLGWLIVLPALAGVALGHLLDRRAGTGITFSAALLVAGVALGSWLAWKKMHQP